MSNEATKITTSGEASLEHRPVDDKPLVLVVEDNEWVQDYVKKIFEGEYRVEIAEDGVVATEKLVTLTPDLIILDIMMPRKDGNEVFTEIKQDPRLASIPVIMFTAIASEENRLDGLERGADDYIGKPFNPRELLARTRNLIQLRAQERELKALNNDLEEKVQKQVSLIVAERKRYEDELIAARDRSEASDQVKTIILRNMSHEVRTPITNVLGFAEILKDRVSEDDRPFMEYIESNSKRLLETVTTILDYSQLATNSFELHFSLVSLRQIVQDAHSRFKHAAEAKGLSLEIIDNEGQSAEIVVDRTAMDSMLNQIIGNAIKFTNSGVITIDAGVHSDSVFIRVKDTGVGIAEEFIEKLFEPFQQESVGEGRNYEGTGLGLAIAKRMGELMGGDVKVASTQGEGSCFTISLPDIRSLRAHSAELRGDRLPVQRDSPQEQEQKETPAARDAAADAA
ncbi:MAG: response regulator [Rhodothermales bacterium]|nr:response regulator [Rhodothermales bacterium]